jgi:hypothetical protein
MSIVSLPVELYHTPTAALQPVPAINSSNAYFDRAIEEETTADGVTYRIDRVRSAGDADVYAIDIECRILSGWMNALGDGFDELTRLSFYYGIKIALLEKAEDDGIADLSPLDSATEQAEYTAWLEGEIGA